LGKKGSAPLYVVGLTGPPGPRAIVPAYEPHQADRFRAGLGRHYGLKLQLSTAHSRARAGLGPKSSCWARARIGPKFRALSQASCFLPSVLSSGTVSPARTPHHRATGYHRSTAPHHSRPVPPTARTLNLSKKQQRKGFEPCTCGFTILRSQGAFCDGLSVTILWILSYDSFYYRSHIFHDHIILP
jgi:hypothetical protein